MYYVSIKCWSERKTVYVKSLGYNIALVGLQKYPPFLVPSLMLTIPLLALISLSPINFLYLFEHSRPCPPSPRSPLPLADGAFTPLLPSPPADFTFFLPLDISHSVLVQKDSTDTIFIDFFI